MELSFVPDDCYWGYDLLKGDLWFAYDLRLRVGPHYFDSGVYWIETDRNGLHSYLGLPVDLFAKAAGMNWGSD